MDGRKRTEQEVRTWAEERQKVLATNLRRLRKAKGLSQARLAEKGGVSLSAYRRMEAGTFLPETLEFGDIAKVLGTRTLLLTKEVQYQKAARLVSEKPLRSRPQILVDAARWLDGYLEMEVGRTDGVPYRFADFAWQSKRERDKVMVGEVQVLRYPTALEPISEAEERGEKAAEMVRQELGLADGEPIRDICGLLESAGVKVGKLQVASYRFSGMSIGPAGGGPAVVVNTWDRTPVERWIFSAARELGHLLLHPDDYDTDKTELDRGRETAANAFAAALLVPYASLRKEWDKARGLAVHDRVFWLKRVYKVSYRTLLYRMARHYPKKDLWEYFKRAHWRIHCPRVPKDGKRVDDPSYRPVLPDGEPEMLLKDAYLASLPESRAAHEPARLVPADFVVTRLQDIVRQEFDAVELTMRRVAELLDLHYADMYALISTWRVD